MSEFRFSVSQLLQEPVGATRQYELDDPEFAIDETLRLRPVNGHVRLTRTPDGILADVQVCGGVLLECGRCLVEYDQPLSIEFSEEFYQTVNVHTGVRLPAPEEEDVFLIDDQHKLDLGDAMHEYAVLSLPAAPRCTPECKGLCPTCGNNLNDGPCACVADEVDDRLAALGKLLDRSN